MNLDDKKEAILLLMDYAVNEEDLTAAREFLERHKDDHISLNIFHEFYSYLPEAQNDAIKILLLLAQQEGSFLIAAGTITSNYLYIATREGAEFLGSHKKVSGTRMCWISLVSAAKRP